MTDHDFIEDLKNGNLRGLEDLVARYQNKALRVVYMIVQDEQLSEDIVVDTFLNISRNIRLFNSSKPFEPYLMRSMVNAALNANRRRFISLENVEISSRLEQLLTNTVSIEDQVEAEETRLEIQQAITALSPKQRAVIVQRYYLGLSEIEMAEILEAPRGTIKWLLNRARRNLKRLLTG